MNKKMGRMSRGSLDATKWHVTHAYIHSDYFKNSTLVMLKKILNFSHLKKTFITVNSTTILYFHRLH